MSYAMDANQYYDPYIWQICKIYKTTPSEIPLGLLRDIYTYGNFEDLVKYLEGCPVKSRVNPCHSYLRKICGPTASNMMFDEFINPYFPSIDKVIFNGPATIVMWSDKTKTVVKCQEGDEYSKQTGLLMCVFKKAFGAKNDLEKMLNELCSVENVKPQSPFLDFNIDGKIDEHWWK